MNKESSRDFAEITVPADVSENSDGAIRVPPVPAAPSVQSRTRFAGRGAYGKDRARAFAKAAEELCFEYRPSLPFIERVQVYTWGATNSFYERFYDDAVKLRDLPGKPSEFVPFFSYIPQYSQLNSYQSNFYFYFREKARSGEYIRTDFSYLLLYIYEIINLSADSEHREDDLLELCNLLIAYRTYYPALDKYMAEWICDFCLLYTLPLPEIMFPLIPKLCRTANLKEFYISAAAGRGSITDGILLESFADYDHRTTKAELPEGFDAHYTEALKAAAGALGEDYFVTKKAATVTRDAFCGSLCAHNIKRRLAVDYYPVMRKYDISHTLGAIIKYTENKLRRAAGIKSRLHPDGLPDTARAAIDAYFERVMPDVFAKSHARVEPVPEYEKFYDAKDIPFSAEDASRIELESRAAAEMMPVADEDVPVPEEKPETAKPETDDGFSVPALVRHMLEGGTLEEYCRARGMLPDTAAARVNEAATEAFGDVLLEYGADGWHVIDDYLEEAAEIAVSDGSYSD